jgi:FRG domain
MVIRMVKKTQPNRQRPVTNVAQYLRKVEEIVLEWAPQRQFYPWFRGHGDSTWELKPRVYRPEFRRILDEDQYRHQFKLKALPYLGGTAREPTSEWEWYFLMQHYGLPTRLLDWSMSALIGLYFAVRDASNGKNAAVWVLDPWQLNRRVARKAEQVFVPGETTIRGYLPEPLSARSLPRYPIAIEPSLNSIRITAQKGAFTLHGSTIRAIDNYAAMKSHLRKILVKGTAVPIIREQLYMAGITETTVFPELSALCRELLDYWKYQSQ